jgi:hypothetical protein
MNPKSSIMTKARVNQFIKLGFDSDVAYLLATGDRDTIEEVKANNEVLETEFNTKKTEAKDFNLDDFNTNENVKNQNNPMYVEDKKKRIGKIVIDETGKRTILYEN